MKKTFKILFVSLSLFYLGCAFINPTASATEIQANEKIVFSTDKAKYKPEEPIRITITNKSNSSIWYINYPSDLFLWGIEKYENNEWKNASGFRLPITMAGVRGCFLILYEQPIGAVAEIKANSGFPYEWDQNICAANSNPQAGPLAPELIESGQYRLVFKYGLKTKKPANPEPWERKEDLAEENNLYSNEFLISK